MTITRRECLTAFALVAVAALIGYRQSFAVPFQFDDFNAIVDNPAAHLAGPGLAGLVRAAATSRPVASLSFALNGWLLGRGPFGFHVVNLVIHVLASWLSYVVARQLLHASRYSSKGHHVALVTALLFTLHPVHTQAVTYIVQRMASLGALFALLSTAAWLAARSSPRPWAWRVGAVLAWLVACGCKQNYVVLPLVLGAVDALFEEGRARRLWTGLAAALGVGGAMALAMREVIGAEYERLGLGPWQTLVEQPRVLVHYLSLLAWPLPSRLSVDRFWDLSRTLLEWRALASMAGLVALLFAAVTTRKRAPLFTFAVLWFFGNLLVEQTVLPVDLYFEHRLYLPSFGLLLLGAVGLDTLARRMGMSLAVLAVPVLALLAVATDQRNALWNDPAALHAQAVDAGHGTPRSWDIVGAARLEAGDLPGAEAAFQAALARSVKDGVALANLGQVAERRGDLAAAETLYRRALEAEPSLRQPHVSLILLLARSRRVEEANAVASTWLGRSPNEPHAWYARGTVLSLDGQHVAAREAFSSALALDPTFDAAVRDRGASALALGRWADAAEDFERVVVLRPEAPQAWRELGYARERGGDRAAAVQAYEASLRIDPKQRALAEYVTRLRGSP